jgi:hypothetical protein
MRENARGVADSSITEAFKIQILLQEYNTLRSEIVAKYPALISATAIGATALLLIVGFFLKDSTTDSLWLVVALLAFGFLVYCYAVWTNLRDLLRCAQRVAQLEIAINRRAGEDLLEWENRWGGGQEGLWGIATPFIRRKRNVPVH